MLSESQPRLCIWTSFEKVQTYHDNYVRELKALTQADETAKRSIAFAFDGGVQDDGNCRPPSVASFSTSGGSSFTTEEASGDPCTPSDREYTYNSSPCLRSPASRSFGAAYNGWATWPGSFMYSPALHPPLQVQGPSPQFLSWDSPDPEMGIYRPGHASMALGGDYHVPTKTPKVSPIARPQRPSPELSTMRSSASRSLRAPATTVEVARPKINNVERTDEDIFHSFFEEMRRPMPAYHFIAP